jgi:aminopeptidase N
MKAVMRTGLIIFSILPIIFSCARMDEREYYEEGVSKLTAIYRNATIRDVSYRLSFDIPEKRSEPVPAM